MLIAWTTKLHGPLPVLDSLQRLSALDAVNFPSMGRLSPHLLLFVAKVMQGEVDLGLETLNSS